MTRKGPFVHDLFNPPFHPGESNDEPSMTKQAHKNECDINYLMDRYERTGLFYDPSEPGSNRLPEFGDFSDFDYLDAMNAVNEANDRFAELPARMRARFENDPAKLLAFLADERNREEALSLGLLQVPEEPAPAAPAKTEPPAQ